MAQTPATTCLLGLSTLVPAFQSTQDRAAQFMRKVLSASLSGPSLSVALALVDKIYSRSGIQTRHSAIGDWLADDPAAFEFFPPNWELEPFPSTARRMEVYERASVDLAEKAARQALAEAGVAADEVTHLVICTCTGFFAPGPDILLVKRLGLRPTVARSILGFMGCYAGFNGLRMADQIIRAEPRAVVLHVCVELCTLHFQKKAAPDLLIANCLFSDGCAAAVYAASARAGRTGLARVLATHSFVDGDSLDQMTWRIGDTGFEMRLAAAVPGTLRRQAGPFVAALLDRAALRFADVSQWAVHPGGRKILEALSNALALDSSGTEDSYRILHDFGNMSSATIYFVLDRQLRRPDQPGPIVALGFGPGLTLEGAVLERPHASRRQTAGFA